MNRRGRADAAPSPPSADWLAWSFALLVLLAVYVLAAVASSDSWFGLNALGKADAAPLVVFAVAGAALAILLAVRDPTWRLQTRLAAVAAAVLSFPLARLFELGGNTVWAPALVHTVIQGAVKLAIPVETDSPFPIVWIAASAVIPFVVFLNPRSA